MLCWERPSSRSAMVFFSHSVLSRPCHHDGLAAVSAIQIGDQRWFLPCRTHELSFREGGGVFKVPILVLQRSNGDAEIKSFSRACRRHRAEGWSLRSGQSLPPGMDRLKGTPRLQHEGCSLGYS